MVMWLQRRLIMFVMLGLTACGGAQPTDTPATDEDLIVVGAGEDAVPSELVVRVLEGQVTERGLEADVSPVLCVGALSAEWPSGVALPEGTTVIGSLENASRPQGTQVFLDVAQPGRAVVGHFARELAAQGFAEWLLGDKPVFVGHTAAAILCQPNDGRTGVASLCYGTGESGRRLSSPGGPSP
jgi:hypothetical protein